jgi:Ala-tRNA(Pro) deacylase
MPVMQMKEFLDKHGIKYITIRHSTAYTAQEIAASAHIRGKELAKTVIVKIDGKMAMAMLPASYMVDLNLLRKVTGASRIELAAEHEFKGKFPGCHIGAMPPFGNLYGMEVFAEQDLSQDEEIAFNAGSHTELIKLKYNDFVRLVQPKVLKLAFKSGEATSE